MADPENVESGTGPNLYSSLRSFWGVIVAILYTRLDLATMELEEEATRAVQLVAVILGGLLCLGMTIFFLLCLLVVLSGSYLPLVLMIICVLGATGTALLTFIAKKMIKERPKFLSQTLSELRKDIEGLRPANKSDKPSV